MSQTFLGKLGTTLLRAPAVDLEYKNVNGKIDHRRLIPGMGEAGFLLSPVTNNAYEFLSLMLHPTHLPQLTDISIHVASTSFVKNWFDPNILVTFQRLDIPPATVQDSSSLSSLANLAEMSLTTDFPAGVNFFTAPDGKPALLAHPPMHLQLSVPPRVTNLHLNYGIRPEVWDKTNGVIFNVSAIAPNGIPQEIFTRTLHPKTQPSDQQPIPVNIPLPPAATRLLFETRAATTIEYDWAYWSDVRFD
jgi:hypothetical protein